MANQGMDSQQQTSVKIVEKRESKMEIIQEMESSESTYLKTLEFKLPCPKNKLQLKQ